MVKFLYTTCGLCGNQVEIKYTKEHFARWNHNSKNGLPKPYKKFKHNRKKNRKG